MDEQEKRTRHAAYMRSYRADPARRADHAAKQRARYQRDRDRILEERRQRSGAGPRRRRWTEAEILDAIRELAVDGVASCPQSGSLGGLAGNRFGSWREACHAAGVVSGWERPLAPDAKYSTVHSRLLRERGTPQRCEECGTSDPTVRYEWALRLGVVNPLRATPGQRGAPQGLWYSTRLDDYQRLCRSCHSTLDRNRTDLPN